MPRLKVQVWIHTATKEGRRFLLLKTRPARGGFWQPVTGSVESGESLETAARREAREESGLEFRGAPRPLGYRFEFAGRDGSPCEEHAFALEAWPGADGTPRAPRLDAHEHVEYRWLDSEQALAETKFPSNQEGLRRLLASLAGAPK